MVELSLETSLQIHQNEALEVSKLQNGGFRRRFWTTKYLQFFIYYFWILREHREFGDTIAIVRRTSYAFWKNRLDFGFWYTGIKMSSQDGGGRRKRSPRTSSTSSSRSNESLSGYSAEKNQHRENSSGRRSNSGKVRLQKLCMTMKLVLER